MITGKLADDYNGLADRAEELRAALESAVLMLEMYLPSLDHSGPCTPESKCSMHCVEVSLNNTRLRAFYKCLAATEGQV
jgi:hypothetical protein